MHDAVIVVPDSMRVYSLFIQSLKVPQVPLIDVLVEHVNVAVPVWSGVLMPEADGMSDFMDDCGEFQTALGKGNALSAKAEVTNVGTTAAEVT